MSRAGSCRAEHSILDRKTGSDGLKDFIMLGFRKSLWNGQGKSFLGAAVKGPTWSSAVRVIVGLVVQAPIGGRVDVEKVILVHSLAGLGKELRCLAKEGGESFRGALFRRWRLRLLLGNRLCLRTHLGELEENTACGRVQKHERSSNGYVLLAA